MRPDVALAFDRMAGAAAAAGISVIVVSGYRSDAEQAALFAAHPDPKWVAPPGRSLHRLATELDLGPDRRLRLTVRPLSAVRLRQAPLLGALAIRACVRAHPPTVPEPASRMGTLASMCSSASPYFGRVSGPQTITHYGLR
jgi:hypothetical protein